MADWQQIVALIITVMAGFYLLRRLRGPGADSVTTACGGCHGCNEGPKTGSVHPPLVHLDTQSVASERRT